MLQPQTKLCSACPCHGAARNPHEAGQDIHHLSPLKEKSLPELEHPHNTTAIDENPKPSTCGNEDIVNAMAISDTAQVHALTSCNNNKEAPVG